MAGDEDAPDSEDLRSRSDLRRENQALETELMDLSEWMVGQNARILDCLALSEDARAAVEDTRHITAPGARKRSLRLVRTALRDMDLVQLLRRVESVKYGEARTPAEETAESWTARLLAGTEADVSAFVEAHPGSDRQRVRTLVRNVRKAPLPKANEARKALAKGLLQAIAASPPAAEDTV